MTNIQCSKHEAIEKLDKTFIFRLDVYALCITMYYTLLGRCILFLDLSKKMIFIERSVFR